MCSRKKLATVAAQLDKYGDGDIAIKFESFGDIVLAATYDSDEARDGSMKQKMLDLAVSLAEGYLPISKQDFLVKLDGFDLPVDESGKTRRGMKDVMVSLFQIYGNRLPWALYGGYMFMVTRPNLHVAERLPDLKALLPADLPWECVDAVWHGLPPATSLYLHILAVINRYTGTIPLHGCGCNHYLPPIERPDDPRMKVLYPPPKDVRIETEVPVSHMLLAIESLVRGLPHEIGETEKSLRHHVSKAHDVEHPHTEAVVA